jgi:large subunit ribosomal protein L18
MYAQVIAPSGSKVIVSASTLEKGLRETIEGYTGNISAAMAVGKMIAERACAAGVEQVAFDRSGFRYHGRVKALAEAARANGLRF